MTTSQTDVVLLASGGLDSTTLAYWLLARGFLPVPVFVNYGQHCAEHEHNVLMQVLPQQLAARVQPIDISDVYRGAPSRLIHEADLWTEHITADDLYLPYRNLLLLSASAAYAQSHGLSAVYAAFINSNHAKEIDCSADFFAQLASVFRDYGGVRIEMPFRNMAKSEVARIGVQLGVPIELTYSCQVSSSVPCGACPNCVDRREALDALT
jgi:7-cyano-7-deazaguanine synthase